MQYRFTTWLVLLILFYKFTSKFIDLLLLALCVFCACIYISYIYPRKYDITVFGIQQEYSGYWLIIPDIIHLLLLLAAIYIINIYGTNIYKIIGSISLLYIYILCFNIEKLYGISKEKMYIIGSYAIIVYLVYCICMKKI